MIYPIQFVGLVVERENFTQNKCNRKISRPFSITKQAQLALNPKRRAQIALAMHLRGDLCSNDDSA